MTAAIQQRAFVVWWHEMDRWVIPASAIMGGLLPKGWIAARIGDLAHFVTVKEEVIPIKQYKMAGVRLHGQGVFHRETVAGDKLSARYITPLQSGALIYSRLFAWRGSFAVVSNELTDCYVSNEFPQFITDESKLLAKYLYLFCICSATIRAISAASTGSAAVSRNRFREEFFNDFEMPLPPLPVQRAIVGAWEKAKKEVADTLQRIRELEEQIEADFLAGLGLSKPVRTTPPKVFAVWWKDLERWSVMFNQLASVSVDITTGKYPVTTLGEVGNVSYGIQKSPANRPGQHARPYLRVANVQRGELDLREIKYINVPDSDMPTYRLQPDDLLVCEGNSADLVGRPAIWRGEIPDCVHQNHVLKVRLDQAKVMPEYVLEYMHTAAARNYFRSRAKFTTNLASINSNDLRELSLPIPPMEEQKRLVEKVTAERTKIANLKAEAEAKAKQAKADVEAMILGEKPVPGN